MARHKEFEREEVLEKAIQVFWNNGYNATSFQTLTEGMCINRQSIYDTYGDKHTLFIEALTYYYQKRTDYLTAHFAQDKPVKELIRAFFEQSIVNTTTEQKNQGCFLLNVTHEMVPQDKDVAAIANKNMKDLTAIFESAISRGIKSGEIVSSQTPAALAIYIVNTLQGLLTLCKTMTDKKKLRSITDMAMASLG